MSRRPPFHFDASARPWIRDVRFTDLGLPIEVSVLPEIPAEYGTVLGLFEPGDPDTDTPARIKLTGSEPRLAQVIVLIHEMIHAAEYAFGAHIPHDLLAIMANGITFALARTGMLGADDAEIRELLAHVIRRDAELATGTPGESEEMVFIEDHVPVIHEALAVFAERHPERVEEVARAKRTLDIVATYDGHIDRAKPAEEA